MEALDLLGVVERDGRDGGGLLFSVAVAVGFFVRICLIIFLCRCLGPCLCLGLSLDLSLSLSLSLSLCVWWLGACASVSLCVCLTVPSSPPNCYCRFLYSSRVVFIP